MSEKLAENWQGAGHLHVKRNMVYCHHAKLCSYKKRAAAERQKRRFGGVFYCIIPKKGGIPMSKKPTLRKRLPRYYWTVITLGIILTFFAQPVLAAPAGPTGGTIWTQFTAVMKDIYTQLLGISTIVAVVAAAIALIVRMVSRNQRAVDEASSWLKRIIVTWVILNTLGFIIAYIQPWIQGGQYTP